VQLAVNWVSAFSFTVTEDGEIVHPVATGAGAGTSELVSDVGGTEAESVVVGATVPEESPAAVVASAANAMPRRARTISTENIDEPFLICTTLAYFAFYLFIILVDDFISNNRGRNGSHAFRK
jgi:hypothetical protein